MRKLSLKEKNLVQLLLEKTDYNFDIDKIEVFSMKDNMGSITFLSNENLSDRKMNRSISEMTFKDIDNIPISVTLNIDDRDNLFELDIWKVDFSKINKYPSRETLFQ